MRELLAKARFEILELRRRNEILSAQVAVVEVFANCVGLRSNGDCQTIDVAWEIERTLEELVAKEKNEGATCKQ
jgi:hypothetical protein